jgi:prevent-host-death family protein
MAMITVGVRELKNRLSRYLHEAKKGKKIVVTERGVPIAVIQPFRAAKRAAGLEARLAVLAARGVVTLPNRRRRRRIPRVAVTGLSVSRTVLENRR